MSAEVQAKPSTSEATVSLGIPAVSVCQARDERKAPEFSSCQVSSHVTVTTKSSKQRTRISRKIYIHVCGAGQFSARDFCFSSQKATRMQKNTAVSPKRKKKHTKNKTRKPDRQALVSTPAKVLISPQSTLLKNYIGHVVSVSNSKQII